MLKLVKSKINHTKLYENGLFNEGPMVGCSQLLDSAERGVQGVQECSYTGVVVVRGNQADLETLNK